MGDRGGARALGDLDRVLGDERSGEARTEKVLALVDSAGAEHREGVLGEELLLEVEDVGLGGAGCERLSLDTGEVLPLADVGCYGNDFAVVGFLDPLQNDGGIEPTGVGEDDLVDFLLDHAVLPFQSSLDAIFLNAAGLFRPTWHDRASG
ncbi:hypothetical protein HRbin27_01995 [bacterium HR27]|nr:hypothetical protein HRbin27_01995 [bacterium HR27]